MQCFYVPGSSSIVDTINPETGLSSIYGETLQQVRDRYPGAEVWDYDEAWVEFEKGQRQKYMSPPEKITAEKFEEMMNIMPPIKYRTGALSESFMMSEAMTLGIRGIYCRVNDQYYQMYDRQSLTHEEIAQMCLKSEEVQS